jgi:hypothetical protein
MSRRASRSVAVGRVASLAVALVACGEKPPPTVTFEWSPAVVTAHYFHAERPGFNTAGRESVSAFTYGRIDQLPDGRNLYATVEADPPVLVQPGRVSYLNGNDVVLAVAPDPQLPAATYTGMLTVHVYEDAALTKPCPVHGGTVAYQFAVDPELTISATLDGIPLGVVATSSDTAVTKDLSSGPTIYWYPSAPSLPAFAAHAGQVLELTASLPVRWTSPDQFYSSGGGWASPAVTSTSLTQVLSAESCTYAAMPLQGPQYGAGFKVSVAL